LIHQKGFEDVKATVATEVVLAYPELSKPFEMYKDAYTVQLGATITQDYRPIAFFSQKLSKMQRNTVRAKLHSEDTKRIQGNVVGAINQSLYRP
jgi:hypothetical protein